VFSVPGKGNAPIITPTEPRSLSVETRRATCASHEDICRGAWSNRQRRRKSPQNPARLFGNQLLDFTFVMGRYRTFRFASEQWRTWSSPHGVPGHGHGEAKRHEFLNVIFGMLTKRCRLGLGDSRKKMAMNHARNAGQNARAGQTCAVFFGMALRLLRASAAPFSGSVAPN